MEVEDEEGEGGNGKGSGKGAAADAKKEASNKEKVAAAYGEAIGILKSEGAVPCSGSASSLCCQRKRMIFYGSITTQTC